MNLFGVGPFELFLIFVLGLIVLGPERLPEVGRFAGRQLAKIMAWQQQSPEAQMLQQIRADFEREIVDLRDELVHARQQMTVREDLQKLRDETRAMLSLKESPGSVESSRAAQVIEQRVAAAGAPNKIVPDPVTLPPDPDLEEPEWAKRKHPDFYKAVPRNAEEAAPAAQNGLQEEQPPTSAAASSTGEAMPAPQPTSEVEELRAQIATLTSELRTLYTQLRARGLLDEAIDPSLPEHKPETVLP